MQEKIEVLLLDWAEQYYRHRDAIFRQIESFNRNTDSLTIKYKDGSLELVVAVPSLDKIDVANVKPLTTFITSNTKKNFNTLIERWKSFAEAKDLKIIFSNPLSELEEKWIIKPHIHNRIADEKSLKQGLKSMFETVQVLA